MNEANQTPPTEAEAPLIPEGVIADALKKFEAPPSFIATVKTRFNQDGLRIDEYIVEDGVLPPDFPRFVANDVCVCPLPIPPGMQLQPGQPTPVHREPIQQPVDAQDWKEAFTKAVIIVAEAKKAFKAHFDEKVKTDIAQKAIRKKLTEGLRPR